MLTARKDPIIFYADFSNRKFAYPIHFCLLFYWSFSLQAPLYCVIVLWSLVVLRIWTRLRMDPHHFGKPDPDTIRIRIRVKSQIRVRIKVKI
jgi:hypothetical protein